MVKKTLKRKGGNIKQLKSTLKEINEQIDEIEQLTDEEKINYKDYLETLKTDKRDIENNLLK